MKKFFLILLIVVASSTEVQNQVTRKLDEEYKVYDWLLACGLYNRLVEILIKYGIPKAIEFCKGNVPIFLVGLCSGFVKNIKV